MNERMSCVPGDSSMLTRALPSPLLALPPCAFVCAALPPLQLQQHASTWADGPADPVIARSSWDAAGADAYKGAGAGPASAVDLLLAPRGSPCKNSSSMRCFCAAMSSAAAAAGALLTTASDAAPTPASPADVSALAGGPTPWYQSMPSKRLSYLRCTTGCWVSGNASVETFSACACSWSPARTH